MAGASRITARKSSLRSGPATMQPKIEPDPSTDLLDSTTNHHTTAQSSPRTDHATLPGRFEPMSIRLSDAHVQSPNLTAGQEIDPLAVDIKDAVSTVSELEELGLGNLGLQFPKCVVVGEQSAGKSSVIEGITGIKIPRSAGTCTRCPLFIKMTSANDTHAGWSARVYLRLLYQAKTDPSRGHGFNSWKQLTTPKELGFATTQNPSDLEEMIACAQVSLLNPGEPLEVFHPSSIQPNDKDRRKVDFSPNLVCIEISRPDQPTLCFYDLPGLINQSLDSSKDYMVDFVQDLVRGYVKDPEALILVTSHLATDIVTSAGAKIVRDEKVTGQCLGILTKPDRLETGHEGPVGEVLDGRACAFGHGYFVVRNLAQVDLMAGRSHSDARSQERLFFSQIPPWSNTFRAHHNRFGTEKLQSFLSKKLAAQALKALPGIHAQIGVRLKEVDFELAKIPDHLQQNAARIISDMLFEFSKHVCQDIEGAFGHNEWQKKWRNRRQAFFDDLISMKPMFHSVGDLDCHLLTSLAAGLSADTSIVIDTDSESDNKPKFLPETPSKKRKHTESSPSNNVSSRSKGARGHQPPKRDNFGNLTPILQLDETRAKLTDATGKVPDLIEPKVVDHMISTTMFGWKQPLDEFFRHLEEDLKSHLNRIFNEHFGPWDASLVYGHAWDIAQEFLATNFAEQREVMAMASLNDERDGPYIFHKDLMDHEKSKLIEQYQGARVKHRKRVYKREYEESTGKTMPQSERNTAEAIARLEPYQKEVEVIVQVVAYYNMAARRFHDSICMRIESKFFKSLKTKLCANLSSRLGMHEGNVSEVAAHLLAQPADREQDRQKLLEQRTALLKGQARLQDLQKRHGIEAKPCTPGSSSGENGRGHQLRGNALSAMTMGSNVDAMEDIAYSRKDRS